MPETYWLVSANIVGLLILVFLVYFALKLRQIFRTSLYPMSDVVREMLDRESRNLFRQIQALSALDKLVDLGVFLPPLRQSAASPDVLLVLARKALALKPEVVAECGSGASTLVLARCADLNNKGHVYSLDHDETFAEKTRKLLVDAGLDHRVTILHAPLLRQRVGDDTRLWYDLTTIPDLPIDLLFVDGPPMPEGAMIRYSAGPVLPAPPACRRHRRRRRRRSRR